MKLGDILTVVGGKETELVCGSLQFLLPIPPQMTAARNIVLKCCAFVLVRSLAASKLTSPGFGNNKTIDLST